MWDTPPADTRLRNRWSSSVPLRLRRSPSDSRRLGRRCQQSQNHCLRRQDTPGEPRRENGSRGRYRRARSHWSNTADRAHTPSDRNSPRSTPRRSQGAVGDRRGTPRLWGQVDQVCVCWVGEGVGMSSKDVTGCIIHVVTGQLD